MRLDVVNSICICDWMVIYMIIRTQNKLAIVDFNKVHMIGMKRNHQIFAKTSRLRIVLGEYGSDDECKRVMSRLTTAIRINGDFVMPESEGENEN